MVENAVQQWYPLALRAAEVRARVAVLRGIAPAADQEDLEQEGLMACWRALAHYDSSRASLRTFTEHVVENQLASLRRARRCRPRLAPVHGVEYRVGDRWARTIELRADVNRVLATLQDRDRRLARLLIEQTPTEAGRVPGIARSTVYERIRHIRVTFANAGFGPQGACRS